MKIMKYPGAPSTIPDHQGCNGGEVAITPLGCDSLGSGEAWRKPGSLRFRLGRGARGGVIPSIRIIVIN